MNKSELLSVTKNSFKELEWLWLKEGPRLSKEKSPRKIGTAATESYIQGLIALSKHKQGSPEAQALKEIKGALLQLQKNAKRNAKKNWKDMLLSANLAVYNEGTWNDFVYDFARKGRADASLKDSLVPVLEAMPIGLRNRLYTRIRYPSIRAQLVNKKAAFSQEGLYEWSILNKSGITTSSYHRLSDRRPQKMAPKRSIDAFIRNTINAKAFFTGAAQNAESTIAAYSNYFETQKELLFKDTLIANYSAEDLLNSVKLMRSELQGKWPSKATDVSRHGHGSKAFGLVFGSMVNGRSALVVNPALKVKFKEDGNYTVNTESLSDIDIYSNASNELSALRAIAPSLYRAFESTSALPFVESGTLRARIQVDKYEHHKEVDSGLLSPVSVRFDENGIYVLINPSYRYSDIPKNAFQSKSGSTGIQKFKAKPTLCFPIEGSTCPAFYATFGANP